MKHWILVASLVAVPVIPAQASLILYEFEYDIRVRGKEELGSAGDGRLTLTIDSTAQQLIDFKWISNVGAGTSFKFDRPTIGVGPSLDGEWYTFAMPTMYSMIGDDPNYWARLRFTHFRVSADIVGDGRPLDFLLDAEYDLLLYYPWGDEYFRKLIPTSKKATILRYDPPPVPVKAPEPSSLALLGLGLLGWHRRFWKA